MRYCYWNNKCPYMRQCNLVNYPASVYPDGYMTPLPEYYSDDFNLEVEKKVQETVENAAECHYADNDRASQDVTRVIGYIEQRVSQEIGEIVRIGMDRKLLDYLIRTMVQYIDKNYDRYQGLVPRRVEMALFDMKRDLGWVFDIMRIYHVSSSTENRLLDKLARAAVQDLRQHPTMPR